MAPDRKGQGAGAPRASLAVSRGSQLEVRSSHLTIERRRALSQSSSNPVVKQALETDSYPLAPLVSLEGRVRPNLLIPSSAKTDNAVSFSEVADGEVICSQTMAAGIRDDGGSCFRPRHSAGTDTATNPSYPTLSDVDQVAGCDTTGESLSTTAPAASLVPDLLCVDSRVLSAG